MFRSRSERAEGGRPHAEVERRAFRSILCLLMQFFDDRKGAVMLGTRCVAFFSTNRRSELRWFFFLLVSLSPFCCEGLRFRGGVLS